MDDATRWQHVLERTTPSPAFVYAVSTTGIYCVPTCPSRRPSPGNVAYFDDAAEARRAGYRACLRCRPDDADASGTTASRAVVTACRIMLRAGGPVPADDLQAATGTSRRSLSRAFSTVLGTTPKAFGGAVRTGRARDLLREGGPVTDAVFEAGYGSARAFYDGTAPTLGMTPRSYAAGAADEDLTWTTALSPVGRLVVVASASGLCAVRLGDDVEALLAEVHSEFPAARLARDDAGLADVADAVVALATGGATTGGATSVDLPLDVRGTAFQARVWDALRRIPAGETRSYAQVAADIGAPTAARAVAGACARNGLALVVPCHRVVRGDGGAGGFRWGLAVKRALLDAEQRVAPADEAG